MRLTIVERGVNTLLADCIRLDKALKYAIDQGLDIKLQVAGQEFLLAPTDAKVETRNDGASEVIL